MRKIVSIGRRLSSMEDVVVLSTLYNTSIASVCAAADVVDAVHKIHAITCLKWSSTSAPWYMPYNSLVEELSVTRLCR